MVYNNQCQPNKGFKLCKSASRQRISLVNSCLYIKPGDNNHKLPLFNLIFLNLHPLFSRLHHMIFKGTKILEQDDTTYVENQKKHSTTSSLSSEESGKFGI